MNDPTALFAAAEAGDAQAGEQLFQLVYRELRQLAAARMARERMDHTLTATALVHEVWLRLCSGSAPQAWAGRAHFFAAAAESMRRILIDQARHHKSLKAGGQRERVRLSVVEPIVNQSEIDILALNEALEKLASIDHRKAELVKLRFFTGLTNQEAAAVLGISTSTADNDWAYARSWLKVELDENAANSQRPAD